MIEHPRYPDGQPILLGQQVRVLDPDGQLPEVSRAGVVAEIHYVAHKDEVWVHTDTGRNVVFTASDLRRVDTDGWPVYPGDTWPADVVVAHRA